MLFTWPPGISECFFVMVLANNFHEFTESECCLAVQFRLEIFVHLVYERNCMISDLIVPLGLIHVVTMFC